MTNVRVARRYAEALMNTAEEQKEIEHVAADVEMIDRLTRDSREFHLFLKSPVIKKEKKQTVLLEIFGKKTCSLTNDFLRLIAEKGREDLLSDIIQQFLLLREEKLGIVSVTIKAAIGLSKDQEEKVRRHFEGMTGKKVRLAFSLDKQVIGGFVARVGDTVYDGSVKRQLQMLRERFAEGVGSN